jgi:2-polyprenyl-6-methoxyphenol hydroxylase-like FAD-dependent oxidoreductase
MSDTVGTRTAGADVIVVGQGVVGQVVSLLLAQAGHRVIALERHAEPYSMPRAVHCDPDVNRLLDGLGIDAAAQATFSEPALSYDWLSADRQLLLTFPNELVGDQGWPDSTMFAQPDLEAALRARQAEHPNLEIRWGHELTAIHDDGRRVTATVTGPEGESTVSAAYLVGCDGANSTVSRLVGITVDDLDFSSDWLVMDLKMPPREWFPVNGQICDPQRPTSCVSGGPGRRRFEFMMMPGDDVTTFATPETAWRLVEPWNVTPADAELERLAMYTFHAHCATRWQVGRTFIAGDAAHRMPPFFGRGMVSGVRDATNLAWKLDYVLRGIADPALLETYFTERNAHVQYALRMSIELGRIICETDPEKVAARDAHLLATGPSAQNAMPPLPPELLGPGFLGGIPGEDAVAGRVGVQGRLRGFDGSEGLADRITWGEFAIFVDARRVSEEDAERIRNAKPATVPGKVIEVVPAREEPRNRHSGTDLDGRYAALFDSSGALVVVMRPDLHGYGAAATIEDAVALVAALGRMGVPA